MKVNIQEILDLIKYCLFTPDEKPCFPKKIDSEFLSTVFKFSKAHDVAHIVGLSLKKLGLLSDDEISEKFNKEIDIAMYRYLQISAAFSEIKNVLEDEKIPYIPLKGAVLRNYYPQPFLRTSSDIDILIKKDDIKKAENVFTKKYKYKVVIIGNSHDVSFMTPGGVHLELHFRLIEQMPKAEKILENIWDIAEKDGESLYCYRMPNEYFLFYHITHMARHFIYGGIGIKPVIDLYFIDKMGVDTDKAEKILKEAGLLTFTKEIKHLFDVWWNGAEQTELSKQIHRYILLSGTYGNFENYSVASQIVNGGKFKTLLKKIFLPYNDLKTFYPVLVKYPILTPLYQIRRWFRIFFFGRKSAKSKFISAKNVTDDQTVMFKKFLNSLELKIGK